MFFATFRANCPIHCIFIPTKYTMSTDTLKGNEMKKYKPRLVKFVYNRKQYTGENWSTSPPVDIHFGNRFTDTINSYQYNGNNISMLFSDELKGDVRQYDKKAKFTESEASILLLKYLEDRLKKARKEKKRLDQYEISLAKYPTLPDNIKVYSTDYARTVNNRELTYNTEAVKIWRKKVKEILASPEYLWEQLNK